MEIQKRKLEALKYDKQQTYIEIKEIQNRRIRKNKTKKQCKKEFYATQ